MLFATMPAATHLTHGASTAIIPNPERGFFQYTETHYQSDNTGYAALSQSTLATGRSNGRALVFRYFYLEKFFALDTIDASYISLVDADLAAIKAAGCKCIIRFAYSNNPTNSYTPPYNSEPAVTRVVGHVNQLIPTLNKYADIIMTIQAGFIGYWGEWYYSDNFTTTPSTPGTLTTADWNNRGQVLNALLNGLDPAIYVSVRYVGIRQYFAASWTAANLARVGFHNDAFEASPDDYGTFSTFTSMTTADNKTYLASATAGNLPMGGESAVGNPPQSSWPNASADLAAYHYNYLNPEYHPAVLSDWGAANQAIAEKLLGYRLRVVESTVQTKVPSGGSFAVMLSILNEGYAAPLRSRPVQLVLSNGGAPFVINLTADPRTWAPGATTVIAQRVMAPVAAGTYSAYLFLPDANPSLAADPNYAIQLANAGTWNSSNGWNSLGQTIIVGGGGTITVPSAPTAVSATAGDASAVVSFTAPASSGGAQITSYTAVSSPGGLTASAASGPITVSGLTNGTSYTFTVTATNAAGSSAASSPSAAVTPVAAAILQDNFSGTSLASQWVGSGVYAVSGGVLRITGHSTYADNVVSSSAFDLTGRTATVQVPAVTSAASGEVFVQMFIDASNSVSIGKSGTGLILRITNAGVASDTSIAYDAVAHAWWRIGLSGTTLTWLASSDGTTWNLLRSATSGYPALSAVKFRMVVGHFTAADPDEAASFDNVTVA